MFREMTQTHSSPLTNTMMLQNASSVFASNPRDDVSNRYGFIPTIQVVDALREEGWMPVDVTQKNVRIKDNIDFTKHLVRFRKLGDDILIGDSAVELLLTNSHDRSSGFILHAGMFRMACANGIVIADTTLGKVSIRHNQNAPGQVIEGSYEVVDHVPEIACAVEGMQAVQLDESERRIFADAAFNYAYGNDEENKILTSKDNIIQQVLRPKRSQDVASDLWTTFNVVQENIIKGGIKTLRKGKKGVRRNTTRKVKSIDKDIKLNKALWEMAVQMQELKNAYYLN